MMVLEVLERVSSESLQSALFIFVYENLSSNLSAELYFRAAPLFCIPAHNRHSVKLNEVLNVTLAKMMTSHFAQCALIFLFLTLIIAHARFLLSNSLFHLFNININIFNIFLKAS